MVTGHIHYPEPAGPHRVPALGRIAERHPGASLWAEDDRECALGPQQGDGQVRSWWPVTDVRFEVRLVHLQDEVQLTAGAVAPASGQLLTYRVAPLFERQLGIEDQLVARRAGRRPQHRRQLVQGGALVPGGVDWPASGT